MTAVVWLGTVPDSMRRLERSATGLTSIPDAVWGAPSSDFPAGLKALGAVSRKSISSTPTSSGSLVERRLIERVFAEMPT